MPTTIHDIARMAGVSISTVSKALNNYRGINAQTKNRIITIAQENDFHPNSMARGLVTKQSHVIGFFLNDAINSGLLHPFFQQIIQGCKRTLGDAGYDILFFTNSLFTEDRIHNDYLNRAQHRLVDGVIMMGMDRDDVGAHEIAVSELPCMSIDMALTGPRSGFVQSNNIDAARQAVQYLVSLGHEKIAFVGDIYRSKPGEDREFGYVMAMRNHNLQIHAEWREAGDFSRESGFQAMSRILQGRELPTALFAIGDLMAIGCIEAIQQAGLRVPHDISVIGFDDISLAESHNPPLTTVRQSMVHMGERAAKALIQLIENPNVTPSVITLDAELVIRDTCRSLK